MEKRPLSLTIIGWFLIVGTLLGVVSAAITISNPMTVRMLAQNHIPFAFQETMAVFGTAVSFACGVGVLKGQPWARVFYLAWGIISTAVAFFTSPMKSFVVMSALFILLFGYFLFRPLADRWFAARGVQLRRDLA